MNIEKITDSQTSEPEKVYIYVYTHRRYAINQQNANRAWLQRNPEKKKEYNKKQYEQRKADPEKRERMNQKAREYYHKKKERLLEQKKNEKLEQ